MKKLLKTSVILALVISLLLACAGCSEKEDLIRPKGFDKYYDLLGKHPEPILDQLGIKEDELTKLFHWEYQTQETVTFHDIPFNITLGMDESYTVLCAVEYSAFFSTSDKESHDAVYNLIRQLTKGLQEVQAVHYQPYRKNLGQFSAEEFDALLTASEEVTYGDYWMLEPLVTKEMIDYKTYCLELDDRLGSKKYYEDYAVLRLGVTILNDGKGNNTLSLVFSPDFFWPT